MVYGTGPRRIRALHDLDLSIDPGQFVVVLGKSGSGKTTLLHLLAGLRRPTVGRVWIGDREINRLSEAESARFRRRNVGIVYQFFNLVPTLGVEHNVALPLLMDGFYLSQVRDRVRALTRRLGVDHRLGSRIPELSGGEMQRVAIARAVIANPVLVLADEPTGNLDSENGGEVLALLRELCDERGITTIVMTHDLEATAHASRVLTLRDGEIEDDSAASRPHRRSAPEV
jgi:putative ABC transport system ATP-binding protein